jgi:hypothetical protein
LYTRLNVGTKKSQSDPKFITLIKKLIEIEKSSFKKENSYKLVKKLNLLLAFLVAWLKSLAFVSFGDTAGIFDSR